MTAPAPIPEVIEPHPDCEADHVPDHKCEDECELDHCDDGDCDHSDCEPPDDVVDRRVQSTLSRVSEGIQDIWHRTAPEHERNCDWWRSVEEPWVSLRKVVGA